MKRHTLLSVVVLVAALAFAAGTGSGAAAQAKGNRLQAFGSCGELLGHLRRQALPLVGPYGLGGQAVALGRAGMPGVVTAPAAAESAKDSGVAGVDFSGTNVQEEGIDEPDLVKTDGASIFAVNGTMLRAVDVSTGRPKLVDSLRLPAGLAARALAARQPVARALPRRRLDRARAGIGAHEHHAVSAGSNV